jgi:hypothetical protein
VTLGVAALLVRIVIIFLIAGKHMGLPHNEPASGDAALTVEVGPRFGENKL